MIARKNKKQTSPDSRERILQAPVMLFARQGYGNTGLRELAWAADVNLAMINYFFGSKKALLKEILDIFFPATSRLPAVNWLVMRHDLLS